MIGVPESPKPVAQQQVIENLKFDLLRDNVDRFKLFCSKVVHVYFEKFREELLKLKREYSEHLETFKIAMENFKAKSTVLTNRFSKIIKLLFPGDVLYFESFIKYARSGQTVTIHCYSKPHSEIDLCFSLYTAFKLICVINRFLQLHMFHRSELAFLEKRLRSFEYIKRNLYIGHEVNLQNFLDMSGLLIVHLRNIYHYLRHKMPLHISILEIFFSTHSPLLTIIADDSSNLRLPILNEIIRENALGFSLVGYEQDEFESSVIVFDD